MKLDLIVGDKVRHKTLGKGKLVRSLPSQGYYIIRPDSWDKEGKDPDRGYSCKRADFKVLGLKGILIGLEGIRKAYGYPVLVGIIILGELFFGAGLQGIVHALWWICTIAVGIWVGRYLSS
jgi:hypothetical protein